MRRLWWMLPCLVALAPPASAHPAPFSYVDVQVGGNAIDVAIVAHVYDLAHDLQVAPPERLLDATVVAAYAGPIAALLGPRFTLAADGRDLRGEWLSPEVLADRGAIRVRVRYAIAAPSGAVAITASLFPYDANHQTFLNIYEDGLLRTQAILDRGHTRFEYFAGSRHGVLAVIRKFVPAGVHHILIGPDHLLFLVGLMLLGGTFRRLFIIVTSFTIAHSVTLSLAVLNIVNPPARLIEPAIALSIVYVGLDNLLVRSGRDMRAWIALAFGLIHGFGFANVLRQMDLPNRALVWSLLSFNVGVEIGQLAVVIMVASAIATLQSRSEWAGRRLAFAGSIVVVTAGAFWFIQRVFFAGGIS